MRQTDDSLAWPLLQSRCGRGCNGGWMTSSRITVQQAPSSFKAAVELGRWPPRARLSYTSLMIDAALMSQVKTLSVADRIELIGAVGETLSSSELPVSEEEKALLDARLADMEQNPEDQSPWPAVQARLRQRLPELHRLCPSGCRT